MAPSQQRARQRPSRRHGPPRRPAARRGGHSAPPAPEIVLPPPTRWDDRGERRGAGRAVAMLIWPLLLVAAGVALIAAGIIAGVAALVLGAALIAGGSILGSPRRLAGRIGGRVATREQDQRLLNLVDGLCVASGLALPEVRVLEDPAANAVLLAGRPDAAVLVVTSGAIDLLDRIELEALLAHELAHLRRGDAALAARATRAAALLAPLSERAVPLVRELAGREREARADLAAAAVTRYPPGLAAALDKLAAAPNRPASLDAVTARLTSSLWCAPLGPAAATEVSGALDLGERAALLREL